MIRISIDGNRTQAWAGERLLDVINRSGPKVSQVCYHATMADTNLRYGVSRALHTGPGLHSRERVETAGRGHLSAILFDELCVYSLSPICVCSRWPAEF